jgi:hypothetical protein
MFHKHTFKTASTVSPVYHNIFVLTIYSPVHLFTAENSLLYTSAKQYL